MESFPVKVYSPAGLGSEEQAVSVTIPTPDGEVGILPHHVNYIALLGTGVMTIETASGSKKRIVISRGFCTFSETGLVVLADHVDSLEELAVHPQLEKETAEARAKLEAMSMFEPEWEPQRDTVQRLEALATISQ